MASNDSSDLFIKEYQDRFEKKVRENEITSSGTLESAIGQSYRYETGQRCFNAIADNENIGNDGQSNQEY